MPSPKATPKIRRLKPGDIRAVDELIRSNIGEDDYIKARFELKNVFRPSSYNIYRFVDSFVVELGRKVIGYGGIWEHRFDPRQFCMLDWFVIDKPYQGKGIGTYLMKFLFKRALRRKIKYIDVETWPENKKAIKFYKKCGFKRLCLIPKYYDSGEDLIIMLKDLQGK